MNKAQTTNDFHFFSSIAGSTFCNGQEIIKTLKEKDILTLIREPTNKFDKNAIAVFKGENKIGYIKKETASKIYKDVELGKVKCTVAEITGGTGDKNFVGCNVLINVSREDKTKTGELK